MASSWSLLSEEQFLCSICLDVFNDPVSTPCGHNYCKACITHYWDVSDVYQCPVCKERFNKRPDLRVNTTLRELVEEFNMSMRWKKGYHAKPGEVCCDVCIGTKLKALKSCLVCLASYCETHLEPHQRVAALKKHKLIDPVENLEDRMCQKHDKLFELFCRTDQTCVCLMCVNTDHQAHVAVPIEEESRKRKAKMAVMMAEMNQMIKIRSRNVVEIQHSLEISRKDAHENIFDCRKAFTTLLRTIERSQAEVIEKIKEKQKAAEKKAEGFIKDLEQEITELQKKSSKLEKLSNTEDHLHLLQSFPSLSTPEHIKDWSEISVHSDVNKGILETAVSQLMKSLNEEMETFLENTTRLVQRYEVDVTLDPDTAHPKLILSEDGKQVKHGNLWNKLPDRGSNKQRFNRSLIVLGKQGFSSGRFYYEVQVEGKTKWDLGVARETVNRMSTVTLNPVDGYWTLLSLRNQNEYTANAGPGVSISLRQKPQKVGLFVDCAKGLVSFYDVEARSHIYSYTGCTFKGKLYPLFNPCLNDGGENSVPLIICPVTSYTF
ncbi:E3 ubiquitin-protein ligase TRIM39-like [Hypomesus transpacificus]|uniref:E3 ubiquitin-protein ligase TRIM39-like n=1 Tax=Hypomesus transpacificus TaxID=137520 RepID=UPI001F0794F8|nr:E3 ubiquitin-protein ligase TRIM39-like [Hypomesus transpacificus]